MADEPENMVLQHLRHIRSVVDDLRETQINHGLRLSMIEEGLGNLQVQIATVNKRLDATQEDVRVIKRRLDLVDA